ncbi:unnamed protein product [Cylindrotheca closterium]|nr:unnamed protein product [Cylindrotheca closterium]
MNDDDYEPGANDDGLALGTADEMPNENYLDALDVSARSTSDNAYTHYKPNPTQKKTLMDEESHGFSSLTSSQYPSARFLTESLQEAENESGSDSMHEDEGTVGDDDLAMGSPDDMPSAAYLATHDVSTRTRTYDPMRNYKPVPVQKKTLMDEEDHERGTQKDKAKGRKMRSLSEDMNEIGSDSMHDDDDDDGIAMGSPDDMPSAAYLASHDVSTRTRTYEPLRNYNPAPVQKKTLMDEEDHERGAKNKKTKGRQMRSLSEDMNESGSDSMYDDDDDGTEGGDGLAMGSAEELPSAAYLDSHDVSTRTRSYDPFTNYKPVPVQKKTLMDEEGHGAFRNLRLPSGPNGASSKVEGTQHSASVSVDTDDDDFEDDEMAIGLPNEVPNLAYLETHDISTRTRSYDPYVNYRPVKAQQKTLMDEEGHGDRLSSDDDSRSIESMHVQLDMDERPNSEYLARQDSLTEVYFDYKSKTTTMPVHNLLDEEDHSLVDQSVPGISIDSFVAEEAEKDEQPNTAYLARQDSEQNEYFQFSSGTTKLPSHQADMTGDSKEVKQSAIEAEIEEAIKNES